MERAGSLLTVEYDGFFRKPRCNEFAISDSVEINSIDSLLMRVLGLLLSLLVSSANGFALSPKPLLRAPLHVQHRPAQLARLPAQPAMVSERHVVAFALNTALAGMGVAKGQIKSRAVCVCPPLECGLTPPEHPIAIP